MGSGPGISFHPTLVLHCSMIYSLFVPVHPESNIPYDSLLRSWGFALFPYLSYLHHGYPEWQCLVCSLSRVVCMCKLSLIIVCTLFLQLFKFVWDRRRWMHKSWWGGIKFRCWKKANLWHSECAWKCGGKNLEEIGLFLLVGRVICEPFVWAVAAFDLESPIHSFDILCCFLEDGASSLVCESHFHNKALKIWNPLERIGTFI